MIALILKNKTARSLPLLLVKGLLLTTVYLGVYSIAYSYRGSDSVSIQILFIWLNLVTLFTLGNIWNRCGRFELALPISTRRLWLIHTGTVFLASFLMLAVTVAVMTLGTWLLSRSSLAEGVGEQQLIGVLPQLLAGVALALAILLSLNLSLFRIPGTGRNRLIMAVVIVLGLLLILLLSNQPPVFSLLPLAAALFILWQSYRRLPAAFSLVPLNPSESGPIGDSPEFSGRNETADDIRIGPTFEYRRALFKFVIKITTSVQGFIKVPGVIYPFTAMIFFWGMLLSGFFRVWKGWDENLRFTLLILTAYILFAAMKGQMAKLHLLDHLPISRKTLYNLLMLPFLGLLLLGYGSGLIGIDLLGERNPAIRYLKCNGGHCLFIPYEFCKISWDGQPKTVEAAWGESYEAWQKSIVKAGGPGIYTPFDTPVGCSADFTAHQISRAVEAIYQQHISPAEIKDRYLETDGDLLLGPKEGGLSLLKDYPELERRGDGPLFPVTLLLVGLIWQLMVYIYLSFFRAGAGETKRNAVFLVLLLAALVLHMLQFILSMAGLWHIEVASSIVIIVVRDFSELIPGGSLIIWAVCLLLFMGAYRLVQRRFEHIEIPVQRDLQDN